MHAVARIFLDRFRGEVGVQSVAHGGRTHHPFKGSRIVCGSEGIAVLEIDLVLPRPFLVVGGLRLDAHVDKSKADLPADILSFVLRGHIHVAGPVKGDLCGIPILIRLEKVEFHLRSKIDLQPLLLCFFHSFL